MNLYRELLKICFSHAYIYTVLICYYVAFVIENSIRISEYTRTLQKITEHLKQRSDLVTCDLQHCPPLPRIDSLRFLCMCIMSIWIQVLVWRAVKELKLCDLWKNNYKNSVSWSTYTFLWNKMQSNASLRKSKGTYLRKIDQR